MKNAIILPGKPSKEGYYNPDREAQSNEHWIPWLQHELLLKNVLTQTPEFPKPYEPVYADWLDTFSQFIVNEETILIGHSCGGGFLVRWLSENNKKIDKLILVAPWLDPTNTVSDSFFKFNIDTNLSLKTNSVHILSSSDDSNNVLQSVDILLKKITGIKHHKFENYGHFTFGDMNTREFPELLAIALE